MPVRRAAVASPAPHLVRGPEGDLTNPRSAWSVIVGSTFSSLAVRDHRKIFLGNTAFQATNAMQQLTFGWLLLQIGDSPFWLGLNGFAVGVAMMVMSPIGGALADAWERRKVMMITQVTAVGVNAGIALLYWLGVLQIWHLLVAGWAMGMSFTMNMPARQSLTAEVVPRPLMHNAVALHNAALNFTRIAGPSLAGVLIPVVGPLAVLVLNVVANSWTLSQLLTLSHRPSRAPRPLRLDGGELAEGFLYCWRTPAVFSILLISMLSAIFGQSFIQLMPSLARDELGLGAEGLGAMTSSMGGGALVGALLLARRPRLAHAQLWMGGCAVATGLLVAVLGQATSLRVAIILLVLIGLLSAAFGSLSISGIVERTPEHLSGRVFGVYLQTFGISLLGSLPAGWLADAIGTGPAVSIWALAGTGIIAVVVAVSMRGARETTASPSPEPAASQQSTR